MLRRVVPFLLPFDGGMMRKVVPFYSRSLGETGVTRRREVLLSRVKKW